ncbi:response regulator [Arthrobacter sp. StoSoilB22]|uniref:response regulator transcription factor n=1 Tax=Arthrobacter sp. StoSoilB22 TaxID=2830996 RepID=UPI001CC45F3F|nr:response regulator [Arthrobacter sp. StoSoilB22]BCW61784.1 response regulator [Arthrobacter sp. StoSoilB22]
MLSKDDADIRDLIDLILTDAGFEVHAVESGTEGIMAVERLKPTLITLDVGLPDMDGREAARLIAAVSHAPILMITAFAERDDELHGIASVAKAYLVKPFRPRQLREIALRLSPPELASKPISTDSCSTP